MQEVGINTMKICFTSSSGGHFNQMHKLSREYDNYDKVYITERTNFSERILKNEKSYFYDVINRKEKKFIFKLLKIVPNIFLVIKKERPDLIISTGALITVPVCYIGKLFGSKVIFIESFAKVKTPTLSGKLVNKIADKIIVQWPDLVEYYNKDKTEYGGTIY